VTRRDAHTAGESHLPLGAGAEFDAIRRMLREWGSRASGIGDDAAVLDVPSGEKLVVSTDASVEGVHFRREWFSAQEIGARAATAALSDLAAMAAEPIGLLLALGIPQGWDEAIAELARGVGASAEQASCPIVGGNVTRSGELSLTITVLGSAARTLRRRGAAAGDSVYVSGSLGGPGAALRALRDGRVAEPGHMQRFASPRARIQEARWLADAGATAAIDISDGLGADAAHLGRASGVTVELDAALIPCLDGVRPADALVSGEEYEILVTFAATAAPDVQQFAARFGVPLTRIGEVREQDSEPVRVLGARVDPARGHDHLS